MLAKTATKFYFLPLHLIDLTVICIGATGPFRFCVDNCSGIVANCHEDADVNSQISI